MKIYERVIKKPWPYLIGGIILAFLNILILVTSGSPWKITSGFLYIGAGFLELLGLRPMDWYYFNTKTESFLSQGESFLVNHVVLMNVALIVGALISVLLASEFKLKKIKSKKQMIFALVGGILMGYGARLSYGCNVGAFFSAIPSFSLHGWVFGGFMFVGGWIGSKILVKYIL